MSRIRLAIAVGSAMLAAPFLERAASGVEVVLDATTTLFSDGFEGAAAGTQPEVVSPGPGSWVTTVAETSTTSNALIETSGGAGPGSAAVGDQYMSLFRADEPPQSDVSVRATDWAQQPAAGTLHTEFWAWIPDTIGDFGFSLMMGDESLSQSLLPISSVGGIPRVLYRRADNSQDLFDVQYTFNTWQLWELDWTLGSGEFTLTIDGTSETRGGILDPGGVPISTLLFSSSNWPQEYFIDGNPLAAPSPPGDFNDDGFLTAADYVAWRDALGSNTPLPNDGGLGTPIGPAHYDLWAQNFAGSGAGSGAAAVPEPTGIALAGLLVLTAGAWGAGRQRAAERTGRGISPVRIG